MNEHLYEKPHECELLECKAKQRAFRDGQRAALRRVIAASCSYCACGGQQIAGSHVVYIESPRATAITCRAREAWEMLEALG